MKDFLQSKKIGAIAAILGIAAIAFVIFELGMTVGYRKAAFDYRGGDNYYRTFGPGGTMLDQDDLPSAHGASGTIIKMAPPYAFVVGPDNVEKAVRIGSSTTVVRYRTAVGPNSLSDGEFIIVIGSPDASSSDINASFIRILPVPPGASSSESR